MPRLYVRGEEGVLNFSVPELSEIFGKYGKIIKVQTGGQGFAFVEMEDERDCDEAIRSLDGQVIQGQKLAVERAKSSDRVSGEFRCYNCNKPGHLARDCKEKPRNPLYLDTRGTKISDSRRYDRHSSMRSRGRSSPRHYDRGNYRYRFDSPPRGNRHDNFRDYPRSRDSPPYRDYPNRINYDRRSPPPQYRDRRGRSPPDPYYYDLRRDYPPSPPSPYRYGSGPLNASGGDPTLYSSSSITRSPNRSPDPYGRGRSPPPDSYGRGRSPSPYSRLHPFPRYRSRSPLPSDRFRSPPPSDRFHSPPPSDRFRPDDINFRGPSTSDKMGLPTYPSSQYNERPLTP